MSSLEPPVPVPPLASPPPILAAPGLGQPGTLRRAGCPSCRREIETAGDGKTRCPYCSWQGELYLFSPLAVTFEQSEQALAEDATCLHHPTKKAVAVCAGTGDYICALCAVELKGVTYSAAYLNAAGKEKAKQAFDRYLDRPDSTIVMLLVLSFVPYTNVIVLPTSIFWLPYAYFLYFKALRLRRSDPLYAQVMGMGRIIGLPIWLTLFSLGWVIGAVVLVVFLLTRR